MGEGWCRGGKPFPTTPTTSTWQLRVHGDFSGISRISVKGCFGRPDMKSGWVGGGGGGGRAVCLRSDTGRGEGPSCM